MVLVYGLGKRGCNTFICTNSRSHALDEKRKKQKPKKKNWSNMKMN